MKKFKLLTPLAPELEAGFARIARALDFEVDDTAEFAIAVEPANTTSVTVDGKSATIKYAKKHLFFRELSVALEHMNDGAFSITEDDHFEEVSLMIDASRGAVPTVDGISRLLDYLAAMGYSMAMLYTEDTVELEGRPYFGYMRGRYTPDELRAIDDYAFDYGIEIIPCLECYGHMEKYLIWGEAWQIKDTERVMLAREDATFEFLDQLIGHVSSCLRSKRIHIGMDEAWDMGRGRFLDKHGLVPMFQIFTEYMERLIGITDKYGLTPMMWSDMYFRTSTKTNSYYNEDTVIPDEVAAKIPESVELVFWHYGEKPFCDDYMIKKHMALNRKTIYCGGLWSWCGHFPEHNYAMSTQKFSLEACRTNGVREAMTTVWSNDNAECDLYANLFGLSYFAELCYDKDADYAKLKSRFEAVTGGDYDTFYSMSFYHNSFTDDERDDYSKSWPTRFLGKALFWQDIMEGLYDTHLFRKKMSDHYEKAAQIQKNAMNGGEWDYLYDFGFKVFDYMATKTYIAENLVPCYKAGDKAMLAKIANDLLPSLKAKTIALHEAHKAAWFDKQKILGWSNLDIRYGGMACRCDTASMLINRYLDGKDSTIEELDQERLHKGLSGFVGYSSIATVNIKV